jgi:3-mercaptopyruvate sulfurtransferase SseA
VVCGAGYRSSVATSLLKQRGFGTVLNTLGGMTAWQAAGLPLEQPGSSEEERRGRGAQHQRVDDADQDPVRRNGVPTVAQSSESPKER